jgi:hypothetical protein
MLVARLGSPWKLASVFACFLAPETSAACPDCPPAREARAEILRDPRSGLYLAVLLLPFVILGIMAAILYQIGRFNVARGR